MEGSEQIFISLAYDRQQDESQNKSEWLPRCTD